MTVAIVADRGHEARCNQFCEHLSGVQEVKEEGRIGIIAREMNAMPHHRKGQEHFIHWFTSLALAEPALRAER
jgi:hypothetical protein